MQLTTRKRTLLPTALVAAASAVALTAGPASATSINITVGSQRIPAGAACVYVTDTSTGGTSNGSVQFTPGGSVTIRNVNVESGDTVHFEWHAANCGTYIRDDTYRVPTPLPTVWNIN
ncbi:hypothetical protein DF268_03505 [Streptomyces sp. V2]|uniref:Secreted protein n=1 Tax=Streptomyces niveiscabiei TaxID=164115 RepID=A0ABW9HS65_9ACTN|nr:MULTISPECIES: hypothetical protein [Streptomyces]MDX3384753.1 hypothetical protein [Streptomyces niveiscabiei]PWG14819.1 hypothetical protein DF268_03505 [Streptomyces sp. V2]QZZ31705.1 hypothetical protein A7X85_40745 [Streptomyces sp. ST1015]